MNKNIRGKVITILAVLVVFAAVGVYPIVASYFGVTWPAWLMQKQREGFELDLKLWAGLWMLERNPDGSPMGA